MYFAFDTVPDAYSLGGNTVEGGIQKRLILIRQSRLEGESRVHHNKYILINIAAPIFKAAQTIVQTMKAIYR